MRPLTRLPRDWWAGLQKCAEMEGIRSKANVPHQGTWVGYDFCRGSVHRSLLALAIVVAVAGFGQRTSAQGLTFSLFERYLESLRENAGVPGMSALVLQGGAEVWSTGFGRADIDSSARPTADTPYLIGGLSQTIGATLLLKKCVDESFATLNDPIADWVNGFSEP